MNGLVDLETLSPKGGTTIVSIEWEDPNCDHGDLDAEGVLKLSTKVVTTFGVLVRNDGRYVAVASERLDDGEENSYRCTTVLPVSVIRAVYRLGIIRSTNP
jgi:hypothetical protein